MIKLNPVEVEACRKLKTYTEKQLADELYLAIDKPGADKDMIDYMKKVRELCLNALKYLDKICKLLIKIDFKLKEKDAKAQVDAILKKASPLSLSFHLYKDKERKKDKKIKNFKDTRDKNIDKYKDEKIKKLEKLERDLNASFNNMLYLLREGKCKKKNVDDVIKVFNDNKPEDIDKKLVSLKDTVDDYKELLDAVKDNCTDKDAMESNVRVTTDGYYNVKKRIDLDLVEFYKKIEWQTEYAAGLSRIAIASNCTDLVHADILKLVDKIKEFNPSDCSDTFRLFGTVIEILAEKFSIEQWEKIVKTYKEHKIDPEELKLISQLQGLLRETTNLKVRNIFPDMPEELTRKLSLPDRYVIDKGEKFEKMCEKCKGVPKNKGTKGTHVYRCADCGHTDFFEKKPELERIECTYVGCKKPNMNYDRVINREICTEHKIELIDGIKQELHCVDCGETIVKVYEPGKQLTEKSIDKVCPRRDCPSKKRWCPKCNKQLKKNETEYEEGSINLLCKTCKTKLVSKRDQETTFEPSGVKPFYKGEDALRSRWRDNWSSTFILKHNSVVRAIDRTFGLPEGADISGTTADTIFGIEAMVRIITANAITTLGEKQIPLRADANAQVSKVYASWAPLILLPFITMTKHGHHAIIECALTFTFTGYINAYQIGKYSTLWPTGSSKYTKLLDILKKWEDAPSNIRLIIDRSRDGFVSGGWLLEEDDEIESYTFNDFSKLNYQSYVDFFLPLRNSIEKRPVGRDFLIQQMKERKKEYPVLVKEVLDKYKKDTTDYNVTPDDKTKEIFNKYAQKYDVSTRL